MTTQCSICFDDIENDNNKIITICNHAFHSTCLIKNIVMNGSDCPNCRKNLTGEANNNYYDEEEENYDEEDENYDEEEDDEEENYNNQENEFDINTFLSDEEKMMQSILMEQNSLVYQNSLVQDFFEEDKIEDATTVEVDPLHSAFIEFNKKNYDSFECIFKNKNIDYKFYKGEYKFNDDLNSKQDFMVSNCIQTLINKLHSPNNLMYCIRGYKNNDNTFNLTSIFLFKNDNKLELVTDDFNLVECNYDEFITNIKHKEDKTLICEKYNIKN